MNIGAARSSPQHSGLSAHPEFLGVGEREEVRQEFSDVGLRVRRDPQREQYLADVAATEGDACFFAAMGEIARLRHHNKTNHRGHARITLGERHGRPQAF